MNKVYLGLILLLVVIALAISGFNARDNNNPFTVEKTATLPASFATTIESPLVTPSTFEGNSPKILSFRVNGNSAYRSGDKLCYSLVVYEEGEIKTARVEYENMVTGSKFSWWIDDFTEHDSHSHEWLYSNCMTLENDKDPGLWSVKEIYISDEYNNDIYYTGDVFCRAGVDECLPGSYQIEIISRALLPTITPESSEVLIPQVGG